ncbi:MAG TPA: hypothetical protein VMH91_01495 [Candidatus Paceibacterota bacterium]|nr:hypothetical protein [Candidatus Paceibacterota bacterium]
MSALNNRLTEAELKALPGQFRVVRVKMRRAETELVPSEYFLVEDFVDRHDALDRWRTLLHEKRLEVKEVLRYRIYDDHGRIVDAVGAIISEEERKAPPGKFRIICADIATGTIKLVADLDDREKAIEYAKNAYEGPYTGHQVHDDTGATLIAV